MSYSCWRCCYRTKRMYQKINNQRMLREYFIASHRNEGKEQEKKNRIKIHSEMMMGIESSNWAKAHRNHWSVIFWYTTDRPETIYWHHSEENRKKEILLLCKIKTINFRTVVCQCCEKYVINYHCIGSLFLFYSLFFFFLFLHFF